MTPDEVYKFYGSSYQFHKKTGMSHSSLVNWKKWGYVPEDAQYKLERITNGELKRGNEKVNELQVIWPLIVTEWDTIYLNYIDLGNCTMFRMAIFKTFIPRPGLFVAIEDKGSFFFGMDGRLHKDYVGSKLGLMGDSGQIADFLNAQLLNNEKQQGHYYEEAIRAVKPYGKIGEKSQMPWHPLIKKDETE